MSAENNPEVEIEEADVTLDLAEINDPDEVGEILKALDALIQRADSPVVRACLEEARDDIAFLADSDGQTGEEEDQTDAA